MLTYFAGPIELDPEVELVLTVLVYGFYAACIALVVFVIVSMRKEHYQKKPYEPFLKRSHKALLIVLAILLVVASVVFAWYSSEDKSRKLVRKSKVEMCESSAKSYAERDACYRISREPLWFWQK